MGSWMIDGRLLIDCHKSKSEGEIVVINAKPLQSLKKNAIMDMKRDYEYEKSDIFLKNNFKDYVNYVRFDNFT